MPEIGLQAYCAKIAGLIQTNQLDAAIANCQHILTKYRRHVQTTCLLGQASLARGMTQVALGFFQRTLNADPENVAARIGLAAIHSGEGRIPEAIWHLERAYELAPGNLDVRSRLERLLAERDGEEPNLRMTRVGLGRLYARNGLYGKAITEFKDILRQDPELPHVRVALAEALWHEGRRVEAVETCLDLLDALPNCLKANLILGEVWMRGGHEEAAQDRLDVALGQDPENIVARQMMGDASPLPLQAVTIKMLETAPERTATTPAPEPGSEDHVGGAQRQREASEALSYEAPVQEAPGEAIATPDAAAIVGASSEPAPQTQAKQSGPASMVPDWLRALAERGSGSAAGTGTEEPVSKGPSSLVSGGAAPLGAGSPQAVQSPTERPRRTELNQADLPGWLLDLVPEPARQAPEVAQASPAQSLSRPRDTRHDAGDIPQWLQEPEAPPAEAATGEPSLAGTPRASVPEEGTARETGEGLRTSETGGLEGSPEKSMAASRSQAVEAQVAPGPSQELEARREGQLPDWVRDMEEIVRSGSPSPVSGVGLDQARRAVRDEEASQLRVERDLSDSRSRIELARLYSAEGDWEHALDQYEDLIRSCELVPQVLADLAARLETAEDPVRLYLLVGDAHRQLGDLDMALRMYQQAGDARGEPNT